MGAEKKIKNIQDFLRILSDFKEYSSLPNSFTTGTVANYMKYLLDMLNESLDVLAHMEKRMHSKHPRTREQLFDWLDQRALAPEYKNAEIQTEASQTKAE